VIEATTVVLTTGTFLRGVITIGLDEDRLWEEKREEGFMERGGVKLVVCSKYFLFFVAIFECRFKKNSGRSHGGGASCWSGQDSGGGQVQTHEIKNRQVSFFDSLNLWIIYATVEVPIYPVTNIELPKSLSDLLERCQVKVSSSEYCHSI